MPTEQLVTCSVKGGHFDYVRLADKLCGKFRLASTVPKNCGTVRPSRPLYRYLGLTLTFCGCPNLDSTDTGVTITNLNCNFTGPLEIAKHHDLAKSSIHSIFPPLFVHANFFLLHKPSQLKIRNVRISGYVSSSQRLYQRSSAFDEVIWDR